MISPAFAYLDQANQGNYLKLLVAVAKLSGLFSDSDSPYISYRVAENIFCRSFGADNLSRSDTAFDARLDRLGIGLKTFTVTGNRSLEKVAEFNSLAHNLSRVRGRELAETLASYRNDRIQLACDIYGIESSVYHIVARSKRELILFETDYDKIDISQIGKVKEKEKSLHFTDGQHAYSFNYSKSTLFRSFEIPAEAVRLPVEILNDPYQVLLDLYEQSAQLSLRQESYVLGENYIVLPLYSTRGKVKNVPEKSGLNQWNASGRKREAGEVYIPVPIEVHRYCPGFFPPRDQTFSLKTPTNETLSAKLCQENSKALMTNPNKALSDWLLRKIFRLSEWELITYSRMELLGMDSVYVYKDQDGLYRIDKAPLGAYERFIEEVSTIRGPGVVGG